MDFSVSQEAYVFLCSALAGVIIAMLRDVFYMLRKKCGHNCLLTDISDIVFWMAAAVIMFVVIFFANSGKIRWYEFMGVILGSVIYSFTLSRVFLTVLEFIYAIFLKIFKFFFKILLTPFIFLYNIVFKGIVFIFTPVFKMLRRLLSGLALRVRFFTRIFCRTFKKS